MTYRKVLTKELQVSRRISNQTGSFFFNNSHIKPSFRPSLSRLLSYQTKADFQFLKSSLSIPSVQAALGDKLGFASNSRAIATKSAPNFANNKSCKVCRPDHSDRNGRNIAFVSDSLGKRLLKPLFQRHPGVGLAPLSNHWNNRWRPRRAL